MQRRCDDPALFEKHHVLNAGNEAALTQILHYLEWFRVKSCSD